MTSYTLSYCMNVYKKLCIQIYDIGLMQNGILNSTFVLFCVYMHRYIARMLCIFYSDIPS